jgi:photosystem II stability/assembly factor-like uncharacterized protein
MNAATPEPLACARGLFKSTDRGTTWSPIDGGLPSGSAVSGIVVDPSNSAIVYAAASTGLFRSSDGGANWSAPDRGHRPDVLANITTMAVDPSNSSVLYAAPAAGGFYTSTNSGANWSLTSLAVPVVTQSPSSGEPV